MKKYRTSRWNPAKIEEIEITRETEVSVFYKSPGSRTESCERKSADSHRWFNSWEEAHAYLVGEAERSVNNCRRMLETANGHLGNVKGMRSSA
jgi:hypothetical protein